MKKNLRKVLVLALGLTTTIASAQFSANSTARINNTDSDNRSIENRIAISADYGAVHVSADVNADFANSAAGYGIYEAYATTDLMGFATMTIGRQDLSFGSGALLSGNDWGMTRYTEDGISVAMNLGGFDVNVGSLGGAQYDAANYMNASGNFGGADINILMMNRVNASGEDEKAHGYDLSYAMGDFAISASMNSDYEGDEMTAYSLSYNVFENLTASYTMTTYGDSTDNGTGFNMDNTAMNGGWLNGNMGYLSANNEATTMGIAYDLGDITLSYSVTTVSDQDDATDDREVTKMSLAYQLNDNCNISMSRFSDSNQEADLTWDGGDRTYLTVSIGL